MPNCTNLICSPCVIFFLNLPAREKWKHLTDFLECEIKASCGFDSHAWHQPTRYGGRSSASHACMQDPSDCTG